MTPNDMGTIWIEDLLEGAPIDFPDIKLIPDEAVIWKTGIRREQGYKLADRELYDIAKKHVGEDLDSGCWVIGCAAPYDEEEIVYHPLFFDAFRQGSFSKSMDIFGTQENRETTLCVNHDCNITTNLIANISSDINNLKIWEDVNSVKPGLYLAAKLDLTTDGPQRSFFEQVVSENFKGLSVGGDSFKIDWEINRDGYLVRILKDYLLAEISGVPKPAFTSTAIKALKDGIILTQEESKDNKAMPTPENKENKCDCENKDAENLLETVKEAQKTAQNANKDTDTATETVANSVDMGAFMDQFTKFADSFNDFLEENRQKAEDNPTENAETEAKTEEKEAETEEKPAETEEKPEETPVEEEDFFVSSDGFVSVALEEVDASEEPANTET